jgi:hypothetical protein
MKNVLIGMLTLALALAAFLTRPTEDDFKAFVRDHAERQKRGALGQAGRRESAEPSLAKADFKDCWLWVEVSVDGKTLYAGLFNHWWDKSGRMERA